MPSLASANWKASCGRRQTVSQDWFRGLKTFRKVRTDKGPPGLVVYAGDQGQRIIDGTVVPFSEMRREIRKLEENR